MSRKPSGVGANPDHDPDSGIFNVLPLRDRQGQL